MLNSDNNNMITSSVGSAISDGSAMAFMLDGLVLVGRLASPIREWLDELFRSEFENYYVGDFEDATSSRDLALLNNGTSTSKIAPPDQLRFKLPPCYPAMIIHRGNSSPSIHVPCFDS